MHGTNHRTINTPADVERIMRDAHRLRAQIMRDFGVRAWRTVRQSIATNSRLPGVWPHGSARTTA